ncbi:hypothetical protein Dalk_2938 [Desulfatibacillum aliphaticivorans]|uniref:Uncharacterized protein n=1 Tax=Desulfatibacillum aliphaticivorans TaxID=218208 RepID=B8FKZ3_DESAL|nr:choice-of-anchor U domain-containing protein [Desulfatibacillum aliphaticivorans]ACL04628.1 hypothetical protein Dalk_2938 [Desulfatibacillum aliphaticivorans]
MMEKFLSQFHGLFCVLILLAAGQAYAAGQQAVVQTTASTWDSAAHAVIGVNPTLGARDANVDLFPTDTSDWIIRSYGQYFYLIGRYYTDSLTKFTIDAPEDPIYQVSVLPEGLASGNPHDMIFLNAGKAYMPMYETDKCWIVNPQDGTKTGEIDLSAYDDGDGIPEMHAGVIVDGKLFLLLQQLDRDNSWAPYSASYVAVIDTATGQEIDTNGDPLTPNGIVLNGANPQVIQYLPENNTIYIAATGKYPGSSIDSPMLYAGGIFTLDPDAYTVTKLIDDGPDGPDGSHPYGAFSGLAVVSPEKGYFVGYKGWGDNVFQAFNPTTGAVGDVVTGLEGKSLAGNETGAAMDENGLVWLSSSGTDHTVFIIDPADDSVEDQVDTNLNPGSIAFCPPTIWEGSNQINAATGTGNLSASSGIGTIADITAYKTTDFPNAGDAPSLPFVDGLIGVTVEGVAAGSDVDVTITFPTPRQSDAVYYKLDAAGDFYAFPTDRITIVDNNTIILTLTDGGIGDTDGVANGTIVDPGGYAMTAPEDPKSTGGDDDDDSGCFIRSLKF